MIIAEEKTFTEIVEMIDASKPLLLAACEGCTAVCGTGGQKQAEELAAALRIHFKMRKISLPTRVISLPRQCDPEFIREEKNSMRGCEQLLSLACGVGVQFMAEEYPGTRILPALNTTFAGGMSGFSGQWEEKCRLCGDCVLHLTGGKCPLTLCPKGILNGPCGGCQDGYCEVGNDTPCVWSLILDRDHSTPVIYEFSEVWEPRDWSGGNNGPRRLRGSK